MAGGLPSLPSDALANYTFAIEIGGVEIAQFQEVSGITSELDVIELKENTADGKLVIHKAPGAIKPPTLTLKRAKNSSTNAFPCQGHEYLQARRNSRAPRRQYQRRNQS